MQRQSVAQGVLPLAQGPDKIMAIGSIFFSVSTPTRKSFMTYASQSIQKVTGFVTRQRPGRCAELLVFQHPTAGIQLPAGTVEEGESLEVAAYREVAEETGLTQVRMVQHLGLMRADLGEEKKAILQATVPLIGPFAEAPALGWTLGRGNSCRITDEVNGFAETVYEETDLNTSPPTVRIRVSGWVPTSVLTQHLERHFYHFVSLGKTPERWVQEAERRFECYWTPLTPKPELVPGQDEWIDCVYDKLTAE